MFSLCRRPADAWLRRVLPQVSSGAASDRREPFQLNLAFTHRGLEKLGLPAETLAGFSREFRLGMAHEERSALLGERAPCDPAEWAFTDQEPRGLDGVALLYTKLVGLDSARELEPALLHFGLNMTAPHLLSHAVAPFRVALGVLRPNALGLRITLASARIATVSSARLPRRFGILLGPPRPCAGMTASRHLGRPSARIFRLNCLYLVLNKAGSSGARIPRHFRSAQVRCCRECARTVPG